MLLSVVRTALGVLLCGVALLASAQTQSYQEGTIFQLRVRSTDGLVYVYMTGVRAHSPACASEPFWVIQNEASVVGRQQMALLSMALAAGKKVTIFGTGTCGRWPTAENIAEVVVWD
jgi:hypothetical protein